MIASTSPSSGEHDKYDSVVTSTNTYHLFVNRPSLPLSLGLSLSSSCSAPILGGLLLLSVPLPPHGLELLLLLLSPSFRNPSIVLNISFLPVLASISFPFKLIETLS